MMGNFNGISTTQLIGSAINILGDIQVPVKYKANITEQIERAIATLYIANQTLIEEKPPEVENTEEGEVEDAGTDDTGESKPEPVDS